MKSCKSRNQKTGVSFDFDTVCPKRSNSGEPCAYCYVEEARARGFNAKLEYHVDYAGEVMRMRQATIDKLNECGGARLFSFGDYQTKDFDNVLALLNDAHKRGLKIKAITKRVDFIDAFADHPALLVIGISVDNLGSGVPWHIASGYRDRYPNVRIRGVITCEFDEACLSFVDIRTYYHGETRNRMQNYPPAAVRRKARQYPGTVCCATGKCATCDVKCGI